MVRWLSLLLVTTLGCARPARGVSAAGQVEVVDGGADAGWVLTAARLEAWVAFEEALAQQGVSARSDAGVRVDARGRAHLEVALLADAGLTRDDVDRIEDLVAPFVAERNVERLTGLAALGQFERALQQLTPEQRRQAEQAMVAADGGRASNPLPALEARFGAETVAVLVSREAAITRTWDALLEARGGPK